MRQGGGKQKGARFEREVCAILSLWVTNDRRKDCFWRSAMSGGRATVHRFSKHKADSGAGDISAVHSKGNLLCRLFAVECKFYKSFKANLLYRTAGKLLGFWEQTVETAERVGKIPVLIAKENGKPEILITDSKGAALLVEVAWKRRLRPMVVTPHLGIHAFLLSEVIERSDFNIIRRRRSQLCKRLPRPISI